MPGDSWFQNRASLHKNQRFGGSVCLIRRPTIRHNRHRATKNEENRLDLKRQLWLRIYGQPAAIDSGPVSHGGPLRISLEQALANLARLPRMFIEPDGSFLWTGRDAAGDCPWQLEGTLYDDGRVVRYIDLRGQCPPPQWQEFLAAFEESMASVELELLDRNLIVGGEWLRDCAERES
jgi:hypothetical protein